MIYDGPPSRSLPAVVAAVRLHLDERKRCLYFNSPSMVAGLRSLLYAAGTDVEREVSRGALVLVADTSHLEHGRFVVDKLIVMLDAAVDQAIEDGFTGVFATGDMTWEFGPEKDFSKLVEYEFRLEELFRKQPGLSGICQYHRDLLPAQAVREGAISHDGLFLNATLTRLNPLYIPARRPADRVAGPALDAAIDELVEQDA